MTRKKVVSLVGLCSALLALAQGAQPIGAQTSGLDVRPLVRIEDDYTLLPSLLRYQKSTFISRGGYVFLQGTIGATDGTFDGIAGRAFATRSQREAIRDILTRGEIGLQRDCVFMGTGLSGQSRITWYGRNGRRNAFRYLYADDLSSGLPACSAQAKGLLEALSIAGVIVDEGGEFFVTPPGP